MKCFKNEVRNDFYDERTSPEKNIRTAHSMIAIDSIFPRYF